MSHAAIYLHLPETHSAQHYTPLSTENQLFIGETHKQLPSLKKASVGSYYGNHTIRQSNRISLRQTIEERRGQRTNKQEDDNLGDKSGR